MTTKATKKSAAQREFEQQTDQTSDKLSVPAAIRDDKPAAKKSASSLLAGLSGKAKPAAPKKGTERPVIELDGEYASIYGRFAPIRQLADIFTASAEALKEEINVKLLESWISFFWKGRSVPENPNVRGTSDNGDVCEGMFLVQERWKLRVPESDDPAGFVSNTLVELGVDQTKAEQLVENEIDFSPTISLRPFNELVSGTAQEQAIAEKLLEFVTNELSEEEKEVVLKSESKAKIRAGFLERVLQYANTEAQLTSILQVLDPVIVNKGAKFATTATPVKRTERLLEEAKIALGADQ